MRAEARMRFVGATRGVPGSDHEMGVIIAQIRRRLSLVVFKSQVGCLLSRIHQVGENTQLAKKREWVAREDERMKMERRAQFYRNVEGVQTLRKGQIKVA